ncbi:hypothetical protein BCY91_11040 [Pelobium manganitolerans]|uniref:Uncharacterized protein n=1 Tax=Pelobium manganitolerans TaxID=1842495 RepID=A0A419S2E4_9SPHI|nr:TonB-dependent receptor [Pelobium manganitolerans]RKD12904.1 hypothetical protein BCY91_11040 [Pelobium manganitolerans]
MRRFILFVFCLLATSLLNVQAQQKTVAGTVTDSSGPLPGAIVYEKGIESNATVTAVDGGFRLALKGNSSTIIVKLLGYLQQEVDIAGKTTISINLKNDTKGLEEVVVVGYGTKKKITQTGATSQITGAEIRQNPSASLQNTLMGRLPGFASQQISGQPGSDGARFNIRGANSYTGQVNVLVIVDDIEFGQPLSDIDPDQVESITILKDAATTAIYGAKGANGVVLITTRRGIAGKPQISFRSETGLQAPTFKFKYLNSYEVATLANQAAANAGTPNVWTQEDLDHFKNGTDPYGHPDVDWSDVILRKNSNQVRNNLNISGGTDKAKYFVTLGQLYQNGIMKDFSSDETGFNSNYYYKRYNFRTNVDIKATKTFDLSVDMSGYMGEQNQPWLRGTSNNPFFELNDYKRLPPFAYPIYNPDGSYGGNNSSQLARLAYNIVGRMTYLGYERANENGIVTNVTARQKLDFITKGLSARAVFGYSNANSYTRELKRGSFPSFVYDSKTETYSPFDPATLRLPVMTVSSDPGRMNRRINLQGNLSYDRTFDKKHHVNGLVLYNQYTRTPGATIPESFRGFSFRTGYDYQLKYIVELSMGYNGSDKFPKQNRYGFFPAASVGWNIAEENFFKDNIKFIDLFKIRASYGLVGDDERAGAAGSYESQKYTEATGAYNFGETYNSTADNQSRLSEGALANTNLRWEKEESKNLGLDLNAFKGKLRLTTDVFSRLRTDILRARQSVPEYAGVGFGVANYAKLKTEGFEIDATYRDKVKEVYFSINGNVSVAKSTIIEADEAVPEFPYQAQTGGPLGRTLGYVFDGFYTPENIATSVKPGIPVGPGDLRYKDLNNDGIIDATDRMILPYSNIPNTIYGANFAVSYKGISLALTLQAAANFTMRAISTQIVPFNSNLRPIHLDTWTPENPNATLPRILPNWVGTVNDPNTYVSNFWDKRADYLRIKSAEVSYALPHKLVQHIYLKGLRVYANGNNLHTWMLKEKNVYNLDPESVSGTYVQSYPQQRIWNFGLQVTF